MAEKRKVDAEETAHEADDAEAKKPGKATRRKKANSAAVNEESAESKASQMTQDDVIQNYQKVYDKCMEGETKSFDAKGALSALDQISKILGLDTPVKAADIEGNRVILTLSDKVGDRGD